MGRSHIARQKPKSLMLYGNVRHRSVRALRGSVRVFIEGEGVRGRGMLNVS